MNSSTVRRSSRLSKKDIPSMSESVIHQKNVGVIGNPYFDSDCEECVDSDSDSIVTFSDRKRKSESDSDSVVCFPSKKRRKRHTTDTSHSLTGLEPSSDSHTGLTDTSVSHTGLEHLDDSHTGLSHSYVSHTGLEHSTDSLDMSGIPDLESIPLGDIFNSVSRVHSHGPSLFDMEELPSQMSEHRADSSVWTSSITQPVFHEFKTVDTMDMNLLPTDSTQRTPLFFLKLYLTDSLIDSIVFETNRYFYQKVGVRVRSVRQSQWVDMNRDLIWSYIGLLYLTGIDHKSNMKDYWSRDLLLGHSVFPSVMSHSQFQLISSYLHFNDNHSIDTSDRLYKVRPLIDGLNERMRVVSGVSGGVLCLDEMMIGFKGRLKFKQYIQSKSHSFGIKVWGLCEIEIYTGKSEDEPSELGVTGDLVMRMMAGYLNEGIELYVDNYFTSVPLCTKLKENGTYMTGTIRVNRLVKHGVPRRFCKEKLDRFTSRFVQREGVVITKWADNRSVFLISSKHTDSTVRKTVKRKIEGVWSEQEVSLPTVIQKYNKNMNKIDSLSQFAEMHTLQRRSKKWTKKVFYFFLELCELNAWTLWREHGHFESPSKKSLKDFRLCVLHSLFKDSSLLTTRTGFGHYPVKVDRTRHGKRPCRVCKRDGLLTPSQIKHGTTFYYCGGCRGYPALCPECFSKFHRNLRRYKPNLSRVRFKP